MRIIELNVVEFGGLKNKVISPEAGMNIIYGENESGKSTLLLFIKYMLYGLGRKSASNSDRERSLSWSGHTAAGSMTFEHGGAVYRIERRYIDGTREKLNVLRLDDGEEIKDDRSPGEYFLGVPKEAFESSSYVGQMRSSRIDGEKTVESIKNMLTSADESVDTARILKGLDGVRVTYLHKNKAGGSLYDAEQSISEYRRRLEQAKDDAFALEAQTRSLEKAKRDYETVKRELDQKDAILAQMNKIAVLNRFKALDENEEDRSDLKARIDKLKDDSLKTDFFPTRDHVAELKHSSRVLEDAEKRYARQKEKTDAQFFETREEELIALGKRIEEKGGVESILNSVEAKQKKRKAQNGVIAALWSAQAVISVSAVMLFLSGFIWAAALAAFIIPVIIVTVTCARTKKRLTGEINDITAEYGATEDELRARLEAALAALLESREQAILLAKLNAELEGAGHALESAKESLEALLRKTQLSPLVTYDAAEKERRRLEDFIVTYEKMIAEEATLDRIIANERAALKDYDRDELLGQISIAPEEITPAAISEAQRVRGSLVARRATFEQKLINLTNSIATLKATSEDPLVIADALAQLEEKRAEDREFYDALTLAIDSIEQAGQMMSGSVTPAISRRASEIMAQISADKYKVLRTSGNLGVSLDSEGFGIKADMLSEGTRDAAYLALRIALFSHMYGEEMPPLIFDEALCQFDDIRAERMLSMLCALANDGVQCLFFTSHKREGEILTRAGIEYSEIIL